MTEFNEQEIQEASMPSQPALNTKEQQENQTGNRESDTFQLKLAGFWTRFWAYTIDLIVIFAIGGLLIKPIFRVLNIPVSNPSFLLFSPYKVTILIVTLLYFLLMTKYLQQTVGKIILGIKVISKDDKPLTWGTMLFREVIGRFISKTLVLPYLLVAFMPKKEALHDLFADTCVVHEGVYEKRRYLAYLTNNKGQQLQDSPNV